MASEESVEYHDRLVALLETVWGEGFLSPGGPEEVALVLEGIDLAGCRVLDIGCGVGGVDILLVRDYQAAKVVGIDVEKPVIEKSRRRAVEHGLSDRIEYRLVDPGPLPFGDETFDVAFSKDAMIHIPDKKALFEDVFRVLKPAGVFAASDWMRCDQGPPSADMQRYVESEGLSFDMAPPEAYARTLEETGFTEVVLKDRNPWYAELARKEYEQMKGPLYEMLVKRAGKEETDHNLNVWRNMCIVLESGELRPGHMRAFKRG
ncbi:MAG: methyltransferase domain-containing protein [Deltaproteobacteria bacterium]|nr:methyltransferase domain-containing protein [Deltaproteobacteria bacterium]